MKKNTTPPQIQPVSESVYLLEKERGITQEEVKATRIGVNESGALLIMKQNPETGRHDPVRIIAAGHWNSISLTGKK